MTLSPHCDSRTEVLFTRKVIHTSRALENAERAATRTSPPPLTVPPSIVTLEQFSIKIELFPLFARSTFSMTPPPQRRRSGTARRWALITTGGFIVCGLTVAALALSDTVDYQFGVRGTVGTVVDVVGFALLWSYSVREWCDR